MNRTETSDRMPWIASYPLGVRWDAELPYKTIPEWFAESVDRWPDSRAIEFRGQVISYAELNLLVDRFALGLRKIGASRGTHIGLYLPNTPHYIISLLAVLRIGGTVVNYSPLDADRTLLHKVDDSETDILITLDAESLYPRAARLLTNSRLKNLVVGSLSDFGAERNFERELAVDVHWNARHASFHTLLEERGTLSAEPLGDLKEAVAILQYTGGTTGLPKGAMLTHENLAATCAQSMEVMRGEGPKFQLGRERILLVLPLFHVYALGVAFLGLRAGACLVLHTRFDATAVVDEISTSEITMFYGVPTMFTAIVVSPRAGVEGMKSLKLCASGGAPLPVEVAQRFTALTGCRIREGWGMTETAANGTLTPPHSHIRPGSCGIPLPQVQVRLLSLTDPNCDAKSGEAGELCIRGPNVMRGYWKNPQATAESMTADGYFRTGDVATIDPDGYVRIVDRTKDMLLCSGYNVYPRIIEEAIYEHPDVAEVCVIGVSDSYRGQSPKAFVVLKAGAAQLTFEALKAFLQTRIGRHEMISALQLRAELPKTPVGKLSKKDLVAQESAVAPPT